MHRRFGFRVCLAAACLSSVLFQSCALADSAVESPRELAYLASELSEQQLAELAEVASNVRIVTGLDEKERLARAAEFDGADAHLLSEEFLAAATRLRWVQAWSAGVDRYMKLSRLVQNERIVLTNMKGVHGPVIAEHVFAMLLSMTRDLGAFHKMQQASSWNRRASDRMTAVADRSMLVVGMGGIGSEIARRAHAFDMRVLATVRTKRQPPDYVDELGTNDDLERFLGQADVVVVALPLTDETRGLFDARRFSQIKQGAWFINVGRGGIVDTNALLAALESRRLAGAGLDVTDPEPLPEDHPLWARDDVIITPHVSARAELTLERRWAVIRENMRRFSVGEEFINIVDKKLGY
ncbi:MAG: D-2-hydroxyacid dehydrogenase [Acidobacteriota bacterium]|nr:MAG: D-2-hydroxyacid dehydrogenase [Acidobacteriota bacterium]